MAADNRASITSYPLGAHILTYMQWMVTEHPEFIAHYYHYTAGASPMSITTTWADMRLQRSSSPSSEPPQP
jgi:hypothetical protein